MLEQLDVRLAHPTLYGVGTDGAPMIFAGRCTHCGRVTFPRQVYGCEACGAHGGALVDVELATSGELISFAEVHRHRGTDIHAPFVMAEIRLDCGLLLRGTLALPNASGLKVGARLRGTLAGSDGQAGPFELRFAPAEGEHA